MWNAILWFIIGVAIVVIIIPAVSWLFRQIRDRVNSKGVRVDPELLEKGYYTEATIDYFTISEDPNEPMVIMYTCPYCCRGNEGVQISITPELIDAFKEAISTHEGMRIPCSNCKKDIKLTTSQFYQYLKQKS
jgi:hypothetical protein